MLTQKQQSFAKDVVAGLNPTQAARRAGYAFPNVESVTLMRHEGVRAFILTEQAKFAKTADLKRKDVVDGLLEAVEMARMIGDPNAMISAYRELARLCGLYEPEKKQIDISVSGGTRVNQIENLSDIELERIIQGEAQLIEDEDDLPLPRFPQPELPDLDDDLVASDADPFK